MHVRSWQSSMVNASRSGPSPRLPQSSGRSMVDRRQPRPHLRRRLHLLLRRLQCLTPPGAAWCWRRSPGVILAVRVKPGEQVTAGQEVCVLEAMKMQNSIRAKQSGVVSAVYVSDGQHVKHHQPLMVIKSE